MKRLQKTAALLLCLLVVLSAGLPRASAAGTRFVDLSPNHWAYDDIMLASSMGIVNGKEGDRFDPEGKVLYTEFATMMVRAFYDDQVAPIPNAPWYQPYMEAAQEAGLLSGTQAASPSVWDTVGTRPVNRFEMATMLYNALRSWGMPTPGLDKAAILRQITDRDQIPARYTDAVVHCYYHGILNGMKNDAFAGTETMTRAQACTVIMRLARLLAVAGAEHSVFQLVNDIRADYGLPPVTYDPPLAAVARAHSADMRDRHFFDHVNPDGLNPSQRISAAGIRWRMCAENIAAGQTSPQAVVNAWMNSPGHRANILGGCKRLGVGLAVGGNSYGFYWTQCFATY